MWSSKTNPSLAAASVAATTTAVALAVATGAIITAKRQRWNSERERVKRENFRRTSAATLFGPKGQWVPLIDRSRDTAKDDDDTIEDSSKKSTIQMLTTHYRNSSGTNSRRYDDESPLTAVIIHGFGCTSLEFRALVDLLQEQTSMNVFTYDRVLFVKDDSREELLTLSSSSRSRDAVTLSKELHALLQNHRHNDVQPPYLLIGHSYGGLIAQHYAKMYPDHVHGMVLIDPAHEDQLEQFPRDFGLQFTTVIPFLLNVYQRIAWTGVLVWLDRLSLFNFPPLFLLPRDDPARQVCARLYSDGSVWRLVSAELQGCLETFDHIHGDGGEFRKQGNQHVVPTSLVIAGNRRYSPTLYPKAVTRAFLDMHAQGLPDADTSVFMAHHSDHWVHMSEPEVVLEAVHCVLDRLKSQQQ